MANYIQLTPGSVLKRTDGVTVHVYMFTNQYVFAGHNKKHNNVASFGGFIEKGETVENALFREFREESHECIIGVDELKQHLSEPSTIVINRKSVKGEHFTFFIDISNKQYDIEVINTMFTECVKNATGEGELENDYLVMIPVNDIRTVIHDDSDKKMVNCIVSNTEILSHELRDINIPAYKWLFAQSNSFLKI